MRRNLAKLWFVLSSLSFVVGFAACEDLQLRSICGDGVVGFGEECDGTLPPDVTCEALGHYDGVVRCGADCRFNVTGCRRCGDGVLDVDEGERYEVGLETCLRTGFLGGDHQTPDCRTYHPETCDNYRTVSKDPPVSRPALALDSRGRLWLSGLARGAFPGHDQLPGCPKIKYYADYSCAMYKGYCEPELQGYYIEPTCDQEFLGFYDETGELNVSAWPLDGVATSRVLALDDGRVALVRRTDSHTELIGVGASGASRRYTYLENASLADRWSVTPFFDGRLGIASLQSAHLHLLVLDSWREIAPVELDFGLEFRHDGVDYLWSPFNPIPPDPTGTSLPAFWESQDVVSVLLELRGYTESDSTTGWHWVRLQREGDVARVTHVAPLPYPGAGFTPHFLQVYPEADTFSVGWKRDTTAVHLQRFSWTGETLVSWTYSPRSYRWFEALFPAGDGGVVVAGGLTLQAPAPTNDATCSEAGAGYFAERIDALGVRVSEASFTAPGIMRGGFSYWYQWDRVYGDFDTRSWVFDGTRVTVGGAHLRSERFCRASEELATYQGDSFLIGDIHLVQLIP